MKLMPLHRHSAQRMRDACALVPALHGLLPNRGTAGKAGS